jgi:hypothetical protein
MNTGMISSKKITLMLNLNFTLRTSSLAEKFLILLIRLIPEKKFTANNLGAKFSRDVRF